MMSVCLTLCVYKMFFKITNFKWPASDSHTNILLVKTPKDVLILTIFQPSKSIGEKLFKTGDVNFFSA